MKKFVEIVESETDEVVESMEVTGFPTRKIDKLISGIEINLDHGSYFVQVSEKTSA